jgi:fibronectin-binding autotransporter adhesin
MSTTRRAKPTMLVLEPRFMFDAAGVATAMDAAANGAPDPVMHDQPAHDAATEQMMAALVEQGAPAHGSTGTRNEIVFVDTRVRDYASIVASVDPRAEVVLIDTDRNGVEQIREALAGREGLDAIHIVSHGDEGVLLLGNSPLHLGNLDAYADSLASIGQALTEDGDIHLYGCDVGGGERGRSFIDALAETTSADIAASDDDTGGDHLGADWDLEIRTGEVTASSAIDVAALASFDYRSRPSVSPISRICRRHWRKPLPMGRTTRSP